MAEEKKCSTCDRLLKAAAEIFAEKGFKDATVAEICDAAGANIAAVNYHFGDKETLYDEVWRYAFSITSTSYPVDDGLNEDSTVEEMIYAYVSALLHRIFSADGASLFPRLLSQEMASPTLALEKIATEALFPQSKYVENIVCKFLGDDANEEKIRTGKLSIIGQCAFYNFSKPMREKVLGKKSFGDAEINNMAQQITIFSLGGLRALREC